MRKHEKLNRDYNLDRLDISHLRYLYRDDLNNGQHKGSFEKWMIDYLYYTYNVTRYVGKNWVNDYLTIY